MLLPQQNLDGYIQINNDTHPLYYWNYKIYKPEGSVLYLYIYLFQSVTWLHVLIFKITYEYYKVQYLCIFHIQNLIYNFDNHGNTLKTFPFVESGFRLIIISDIVCLKTWAKVVTVRSRFSPNCLHEYTEATFYSFLFNIQQHCDKSMKKRVLE